MTRILTRLHPDRKTKNFDTQVIERTNRWMFEGSAWCQPIHSRSEDNNLFTAGDTQWKEGDARRNQDKERPTMPMNKLLQVVNACANREIMNRYVSKIYPRAREDQGWADGQDEFLRWVRDMAEVEHEESMAFRSNVTSGYACLHTYFDPLEDEGRGLIMLEEVPIWGLLWDSRARKQNLTDRRWHLHGKWISKAEAEEEFGDVSPAAKKMFREMNKQKALGGMEQDDEIARGGRSSGGRWSWDAVVGGRWFNRAEEELFLVEAEWRDVKVQYKAAVPINFDAYAQLVSDPSATVYVTQNPDGSFNASADKPDGTQEDPNTGQLTVVPQGDGDSDQDDQGLPQQPIPVFPVTGDQFSQMDPQTRKQIQDSLLEDTKIQVFDDLKGLDQFAQQYLDVVGVDFQDFAKDKRYCYYYAVRTNDVILETGERPQGFTYEFMTGFPKSSREGMDFFGIVDVAKGPQDWRNTLMSLVLTRLAVSPKAPVFIESDAVEDLNDFLNQYANPRGPIIVPPGFNNSGKWKELANNLQFAPLESQLITMADQMVGEVAGLSGVDVGSQSDLRRVSGTVVSSVKDSSNTILALLFDSLRRYRKRSAKLILEFMREFYSPDEVAKIIGQKNAPYMDDQQDWPEFLRFHVKIDEAPTSVTERMELFDFLTRTGTLEEWQKQGVLPLEIILEWIPYISQSDRDRILQYRDQQEQNQQNQSSAKPPSVSISFSDLTPDEQDQAAQLAGLQPNSGSNQQPPAAAAKQ